MGLAVLARRLGEIASRGVVLRRQLPDDFGGGALFVTPAASLRLWLTDLKQAEPLLFALAAELVQPGQTVWDLGANVGVFAFAAAYRSGAAGSLVALEPHPRLAAMLRRSAASMPPVYAPVRVVEAAVSSHSGTSSFAVAARGLAASHLAEIKGSSQTGGVRRTVTVDCVSLDDLLDDCPAPHVLKIDVEGAEVLALRGAERLLATCRPIVLGEVSASNAEQVGAILSQFEYTLYDAALPRGERRPLHRPTWNTIALPNGSSHAP